MFVKFIVLLIFSFKFSFGKFEVDFFDVGQGNCTVVKCPKGHPLLVDAGSSQGKAGEKKTNTIGKIVERLISIPNESTDGTHLSIFVSHGDDDHTNWIKDIVTNFKENLRGQGERNVQIRFLLGGRPDHYSKGFREFVEQYRQFGINQRLYISEHIAAGSDLQNLPLNSGDVEVKLLAALDDADPNVSSLVLKLAHQGKSVLLTGDATGATIESIPMPAAGQADVLMSDILQAAHHGADSHESNSEAFIKRVNPSYVVLSAGDREDYSHPKASVVRVILNEGCLETTACFHKVRFHSSAFASIRSRRSMSPSQNEESSDKILFKTYAHECSGYFWASTCEGIYGTNGFDQGRIRFSWDIGVQAITVMPLDSYLFHNTLKENITSTLSRLPLSLEKVTKNRYAASLSALDLAEIDLNAGQLQDIIVRAQESPYTKSTLELFNLRRNKIEQVPTVTLDQMKKLPLAWLDLQQNTLSDEAKGRVRGKLKASLNGLLL